MGRPQTEIDVDSVFDMAVRGFSQKDQAEELGVSVPTLSKRIAEIQKKQGLLLQYRAVQNLQLTELQARCLEAITPEKINEAPLRDLIFCYKVLKDKELVDTGKPTDIKGLMHYLIKLEKEESALNKEPERDEDIQDAEFDTEDLSEYIPDL